MHRIAFTLMAVIVLSGCLDSRGVTPNSDDPVRAEAQDATGTVTYDASARTPLAVPFPCVAEVPKIQCQAGWFAWATMTVDHASPDHANLTATWTASTPLSEKLTIRMSRGSEGPFTATGTSPVTFDLPPQFFAAPGDYVVQAVPTLPGANVDQEVAFTLTLTGVVT